MRWKNLRVSGLIFDSISSSRAKTVLGGSVRFLRSATITGQINDVGNEMSNLKQCLNLLGTQLNDDMISPMVQALHTEDMQTMEMMPKMSPLDMDVHIAMSDLGFCTAEVGMMQGLLTMARVLNNPKVIQLLEETLQFEENDLQKLQGIFSDLFAVTVQFTSR
jgi:ferritin-like metal-binding protein YciE